MGLISKGFLPLQGTRAASLRFHVTQPNSPNVMHVQYNSKLMEITMHIRIMVILLSAVITTSCSTTKLSSKELSEFDVGKKAIVKTNNQPILAGIIVEDMPVVQIIAVDGRKIDSEIFKLDEQIAIDVGSHQIEFSCTSRGGYDERDFTEIIQLDLTPHHEYLVRCSFDSAYGTNGSYEGSFSIKEKNLK